MPPPNLNRCLDACELGTHWREEFYRSMKDYGYSSEKIRECWSASRDSLKRCQVMCESVFGS
jgi:hypothetical protein